ncbi:TIGR03085 family metal-binding protein [Actinoplanes derwentensis]|uniref:TIGR03085 family protein n=1 Tax=Actinoplanes derwentensis TaxID=113562 RepID=A0A1H2BZ23_9ACTN|nr:TIGR03085 family metal-binding protein [Actinoplanes derwentensis]GID90183.1 TIGR03085 family protein [Actinoplanes derwentensis]SDT63159.1 TIGR03085 family protein [Actinoplanes derwentensis]
MTNHARAERDLLADLLLREGPDAPTLCEGWTTRDLAAHIVVRERRPDSAIGMLVKPLAAHGERVRLARATLPYNELISQLRRPPVWSPVSNPVVEPLTNTMEFFIHHEDVRRGPGDWQPRLLDQEFEAALWSNVKLIARTSLRRLGITAAIDPAGLPPIRNSADPQVRISGDAGELALFFFGRQRATRVTVEGPAEVVERLRTARPGI